MTRYAWYTQLQTLVCAPERKLNTLCSDLVARHIGEMSAAQIIFELAQSPRWSNDDRANEELLLDALLHEALHYGFRTDDLVIAPWGTGPLIAQIAELVLLDGSMSASAVALYERLLKMENAEDVFTVLGEMAQQP